ncbi:hypothetical protein ATCC90586_000114 [Pythium insidiosum]|nr:hypothetical protein ATCC90586_000114 [Pythium insidiosum]
MALALRFAEEAEFSSRACEPSYDDEPEAAPSRAFFRWSRAAREHVGGVQGRLAVQTLVVATPNAAAQRFLRGLTQHWQPIGTLVVSDQRVPSVSMSELVAATELRSPVGPGDSAFGRHVAVIVPTELSSQSIWTWTQTLLERVEAQEIVVLESQLSTIYSHGDDDDDVPSLRVLTTSAARDEKLARLLPTLETPRFLVGVAAALLTQGELRHRRVRAFVSLCTANTPVAMATRSFAPLLSLLDLPSPAFSSPPAGSTSIEEDEFSALYT